MTIEHNILTEQIVKTIATHHYFVMSGVEKALYDFGTSEEIIEKFMCTFEEVTMCNYAILENIATSGVKRLVMNNAVKPSI